MRINKTRFPQNKSYTTNPLSEEIAGKMENKKYSQDIHIYIYMVLLCKIYKELN